jgi:hypothetical protein
VYFSQDFPDMAGFKMISPYRISEEKTPLCLLFQLVKTAGLRVNAFLSYSKNSGVSLTLAPTLVSFSRSVVIYKIMQQTDKKEQEEIRSHY